MMMLIHAKKIVSLGVEADYLKARDLVAKKSMKLPSSVLCDDQVIRRKELIKPYGLYWERPILVHPAANKKFTKKDVVDHQTGWCLPANYLTDPRYVQEDVFQKGIGLVVDPADVIEQNGRIVVIPASIIVFHDLMQVSGQSGKVHEATRLPLATKPQKGEERRLFYRTDGIGVRPFSRELSGAGLGIVLAHHSPDTILHVAGEASGALLNEFEPLITAASRELQIPHGELAAVRHLIQVLELEIRG